MTPESNGVHVPLPPLLSRGYNVMVQYQSFSSGFLENWYKDQPSFEDYFQTLFNALNHHLAIGLLRLRGGIDLVEMANQDDFFVSSVQMTPREKKISECSESLDSGLDETEKVESDPSPPVRNIALQVL